MIKTSHRDQIQIIELNRPKVNAINEKLIKSLLSQLDQTEKDKSIRGLSKFNNKNFYFVHSYYPDDIDKKNILMYTKYFGLKFPSVVKKQNIIACQFHPEKSGKFGLKFLKTFLQ